jgi:hypothetical protein
MLKKCAVYGFFIIVYLAAASSFAFGQGAADIYLIKITLAGEKYEFSHPLKINPSEGYNNQPSFHADGNSVFYSSGTGQNTDIYRYDIQSRQTTQLTKTPDSEYSPLLMPGETSFSVIQLVITDGPRKGAQPLLSFPIAGGKPKIIYEDGKKVGYHAWIDKVWVAMFVLGEPNYLQLVNLSDMNKKRIAENVGRSLYKIPGQNAVSFSQGERGKPQMIKRYDLKNGKTEPLAAMLEGNGFYAWTSTGSLVMGVGSNLFEFEPGKDTEWQLIGNLSTLGISTISRLAIDPHMKWLAVVNSR